MKRKEIEKVLNEKINIFGQTINVLGGAPDIFTKSIMISGGSISSMLLDEPVNDFDFYFLDPEICGMFLHNFLHDSNYELVKTDIDTTTSKFEIKEKGTTNNSYPKVTYGKQLNTSGLIITPDKISQFAITFGDKQYVFYLSGPQKIIHKSFDMVHCINYYTLNDGLVLNKFALESILTKEIRLISVRSPYETLKRVHKMLTEGWTIPEKELLKLLWQMREEQDIIDASFLKDNVLASSKSETLKHIDGELSKDLFNTILEEIFP